jgi:hypothetical protein
MATRTALTINPTPNTMAQFTDKAQQRARSKIASNEHRVKSEI